MPRVAVTSRRLPNETRSCQAIILTESRSDAPLRLDEPTRGERVLHWFRSDLRLRDNTRARRRGRPRARAGPALRPRRAPARAAPRSAPPRLRFLLDSLARLGAALEARGQRLLIARGRPEQVIPALLRERPHRAHHLEPRLRALRAASRRRGAARRRSARRRGRGRTRIASSSRAASCARRRAIAFRVYTPFRNAWWERWHADPPPLARAAAAAAAARRRGAATRCPTASAFGVAGDATALPTAGEEAAARRLDALRRRRRSRTTRATAIAPISTAPRGSRRICASARSRSAPACTRRSRALHAEPRARDGARKWIDELIWREFYHAILAEHPHVLTRSFRPEYDALRMGRRRGRLSRLVRGTHRLSVRRRRDAPARGDRLDAQPRAHGRRELPHQGSRHRLAARRALLLPAPRRRRSRPRTTAAGSGRRRPAPTRSRTSGSSIRSRRASASIRTARYVRRFVPELRDVDARFVQRPWQAPSPPRDYPRADRRSRRARVIRAAPLRGGARGERRHGARGKRGRNLELF